MLHNERTIYIETIKYPLKLLHNERIIYMNPISTHRIVA